MLRKVIILPLLLSISVIYSQSNRTIDGFGNNRSSPQWGSAGSELLTQTSNGFENGIDDSGGLSRPNPRVISNLLFQQDSSIYDKRNLSEYVWAFGQFLDHDISLVNKSENEYLKIKIPINDEYFTPGNFFTVSRSLPAPGSGTDLQNPRKFINEISTFIDGSQVYGSDEKRANWLRTFEQGKLKTSPFDRLPWNTLDLTFNSPVDPDVPAMDDDTGRSSKLYVAGDVRANEHPLLIALHTIFVREHNRICENLSANNPAWDDELIYQKARKIVGGQIQSIVYGEWLPAVGIDIPEYTGYDPDVEPGIFNVFSAAAFRLGHTLITNDVVRLRITEDTIPQGNIDLKYAFFNPALISLAGGIDPYLAAIAQRKQQLVDCKMVNGVRNFLFASPFAEGIDLAMINIVRGRERGLPDYNTIRKDFGLQGYTSFEDLSGDKNYQSDLIFLYGNIDNIDPWVGMLSESHAEDKMVGELLHKILYDQFSKLRDGDRFYFENDLALSSSEIENIKNTSLKDIIERNTDLSGLQDNVFFIDETEKHEGPSLAPVALDAVIYPNPSDGKIRLKYYLLRNEKITLSLMNHLGQRIYIETFEGETGDNFKKLNLALLPGVYHLLLESPGHFRTLRIQIQKNN